MSSKRLKDEIDDELNETATKKVKLDLDELDSSDEEEELSGCQQRAWRQIVEEKKSGLLTGGAGTGKSFLIRKIVGELKGKTVVTATTGIAAILCGGVTVNSFFKISPVDLEDKDTAAQKLVKRAKENRFFKKQVEELDTLIIDEVSMLSVDLFKIIDLICQECKNRRGIPFGGLQVLLVGDFFQLPPVSKGKPIYLFEIPEFWRAIENMWELKQIWRQNDPLFCDLLSRARKGLLTEEDKATLKTREGQQIQKGDIKPTRMFAKRVNVDEINSKELAKLDAKQEQKYQAIFLFHSNDKSKAKADDGKAKVAQGQQEKLLKDLAFEKQVSLRVGAQVMLACNLNVKNKLANGSRGVVIGFEKAKNPQKDPAAARQLQCFFDGKKKQYRLPGHYYFAPENTLLPVVDFGDKTQTIPFAAWTRKLNDLGEIEVLQMPLRLAWASTIHRVQGQTLDLVDAQLDASVFEVGQAYVALSRAKTLEGLQLSSFDPAVVKADERVKAFYEKPFDIQRREKLEDEMKEFFKPQKKNRDIDEEIWESD